MELKNWIYAKQDEFLFAFTKEILTWKAWTILQLHFNIHEHTGRIFDGRFFSAKISSNLAGHGQITCALGNGRDLSPIWIVVNTQKKHMFNWHTVLGWTVTWKMSKYNTCRKTFKNSSLTGWFFFLTDICMSIFT